MSDVGAGRVCPSVPPDSHRPTSGWIRARIDADYHGVDALSGELPWRAGVHLVRAHLTGVVRADGPPDEELSSLRQVRLTPAWLELGPALYPVTLHDVHVANIERVGAVVRQESQDVVGRLRGTVWARLGDLDQPAPEQEHVVSDERAEVDTDGAVAPEGAGALGGEVDGRSTRCGRGPELPEQDGNQAEPALPETSDGEGSEGSAHHDDRTTDAQPVGLGEGEGGPPSAAVAVHDESSDGRVTQPVRPRGECGCGCLPVLAGLTLFVIIVSCGITLAIVWIGVMASAHFAQRWMVARTRELHGCVNLLAGATLVGLHVVILVHVLADVGAAPCDPRSYSQALLLALPVFASATVAFRSVWLATSAIWSVGLLVWCTQADELCLAGTDEASSRDHTTRALERTANQVQARLQEVVARDESARILAENTDRMSVDDALLYPSLFFGRCGQPLVLSGDILFGHDSDRMPESAEPHLRKLRRLLAMQPDARIVVVGHADPKGDPAYNIDLSLRRARAVRDWLHDRGGVSPERVEVVGRGSEEPVVTDMELQPLNRRVEVSIACD